MKKNTRTLLITVISFAVVITIAAVAYNMLKERAPAVSFTPTIAAEQEVEPTVAKGTSAGQLPTAPVVAEDSLDSDSAPAMQESRVPESEATQEQQSEEKPPMMPNLPLTRLDGSMTSVSDVRDGRPAIINYFASWCPPCRQELPHFQKAYDEYGSEISFIFLDALDGQRETLKTITAFIEDFPFTGPVFYDDGMFAAVFQTNSLPTTVFLDKEGRVVKGYLGFVSEEVLYADITALLD